MHPFQMSACQMNWAANTIALNLDFIPDDKSPETSNLDALSALEIVEHLVGVFYLTPLSWRF